MTKDVPKPNCSIMQTVYSLEYIATYVIFHFMRIKWANTSDNKIINRV